MLSVIGGPDWDKSRKPDLEIQTASITLLGDFYLARLKSPKRVMTINLDI